MLPLTATGLTVARTLLLADAGYLVAVLWLQQNAGNGERGASSSSEHGLWLCALGAGNPKTMSGKPTNTMVATSLSSGMHALTSLHVI